MLQQDLIVVKYVAFPVTSQGQNILSLSKSEKQVMKSKQRDNRVGIRQLRQQILMGKREKVRE